MSRAFSITLFAVGLALVLAATAWIAWQARQWTLRELGSPQGLAQWQHWKSEVAAEQSQPQAGVRRRVPKSDFPPALILMRDRFPAVLGCSLLISAFLYSFLLLAWRGSRRTPPPLLADVPKR